MFGLPGWGSDPFADIIARKYGRRRRPAHPRYPDSFDPTRHPHWDPHSHHAHSTFFPNKSKAYKTTRFSDLATPSISDFSSSEWEEEEEEHQYALDTDTDTMNKHRQAPMSALRKKYPSRSASAPNTRRVSVTLPSATADALRPDETLLLPDLVHVHIRVFNHRVNGEQILRVAVPETMRFGDLVGQVLGDGVRVQDVTAAVKQRGRWSEQDSSARLEDLRERGEVVREGGKVVEVKIEIGDDGLSARGYGGRRGPRGGAGGGGERVWRRRTEEARVKTCL